MPGHTHHKASLSPTIIPIGDYDALRIWVADRYSVDRFEIAYEFGMEPEPITFTDEDDFDGAIKAKFHDWVRRYHAAKDADPERLMRIVAKICLQYADIFLEMAGIKRPPSDLPPAIHDNLSAAGGVFDIDASGQRVNKQ